MAPRRKRNVSSGKAAEVAVKSAKVDLDGKVDGVLRSRKRANDVFDVLELLQVGNETSCCCFCSG